MNVDISEILGNEQIVYFKTNEILSSAILPTNVDTSKPVKLSINTNDLLFFDVENETRIY